MSQLDFILTPGQQEIAESKARFRVITAGRRWGKSTLALSLAIDACLKKTCKVWIVSPTYSQSKDIYWRDIQKISWWYAELNRLGSPVKKNDSELLLEFANKSVFQLKGSDREDTLRGSGLEFVVLDEAASMKPDVWGKILMPSLLDSGGKALIISTPMGFNWFYDLWLKGKSGNKDWQSWQYTSYQNPTLDKTIIEQAKIDSDEETFDSEYLAQFRKYSGLVYREFDEAIHIIDPIDLPSSMTFGIGVDRGMTNPSGIVFVAIDGEDTAYVYDEIYVTDATSDKLLELIKQKQSSRYITHRFCDPSARDFIEHCRQNGYSLEPAKKEGELGSWVINGISVVKSRLKVQPGTGQPKLKIFSHCKNLIKEFKQYRWLQEKQEGQAHTDRPDKQYGFDHLLDALRYILASIEGKTNDSTDWGTYYRQQREWDNKNWSFK